MILCDLQITFGMLYKLLIGDLMYDEEDDLQSDPLSLGKKQFYLASRREACRQRDIQNDL
ncbi:unnamed protein product [Moneuplotes crassus]|uniref:Uncharacterized protein n=1 Tax=Euplotes crassus TaxID=5936 RepID=A0AAD1U8E4_EUPCR|nr:unnamed protein product [Moneuplotes crassus]